MPAISENMFSNINAQMNREFFNERVYLSLSSYFKVCFLDGIAGFFEKQASGEHEHATKFINFMIDRFSSPELTALDTVPYQFESATACFQAAFDLENGTTREIWHLAELAEGEKDYATREFMDWYIAEQVEEENTIGNWLYQVRLNDNPLGLLEINEMMSD